MEQQHLFKFCVLAVKWQERRSSCTSLAWRSSCKWTKAAHGLTRHLRCTPAAETGKSSGRGRNLHIQIMRKDIFYEKLLSQTCQEWKHELVCVKLTTSCLEVWEWWNENLMKEQGTAVHFDGTREQTTKVVDVPEDERCANMMGWEERDAQHSRAKERESNLFCEGCKEEETLSSQNFLIANVVRAWSALWTQSKKIISHLRIWKTNHCNCFNLTQRILLFWWQMWWRLPSWYLAVVHIGSHDDPCLPFVSLYKHSSSLLCIGFCSCFLFCRVSRSRYWTDPAVKNHNIVGVRCQPCLHRFTNSTNSV